MIVRAFAWQRAQASEAMLWIETRTPEEAKHLQDHMWGIEVRESAAGFEYQARGEGLYENGEFWADAIRKLKDDSHKRLDMARRHLPLPAAFQHAAISLRAIVRQNRKQGTDSRLALQELYHLAAISSFSVPYAARLQQPGYNVLARVPFSEFQSMSLTWETLGHEKLELLTNTDRQWMREAWGDPPVHTTAHHRYWEVWNRYEDILVGERDYLYS
jgi:hypothetical protein